MSSRPETPEEVVAHGETGMVLAELRRIGKQVDALAEKLDLKHGQLEERLRAAEMELARVTTKIGVATGMAGLVGAAAVELFKLAGH